MSGEIERVKGSVQPYHVAPTKGPEVFTPYHGGMPQMAHMPDHMAVRPPETGSTIQDKWAKNPIILVIRGTCHGVLWLTTYWWRTTITFLVITMFVIIFIYG